MISVENVTKNFGAITAVNGVSFTIQAGEVVGFLGPNGAGKSTTMRMIAGFFPPDSGRVLIDGEDNATHPLLAKSKIGYLPESAALYTEMEVTDYLLFMGRMHRLPADFLKLRLKTVIRECQLSPVLGRKIHALSKGYRQRVGLAAALLHDPKILILDEPTVGLDPNQIMEIRELIRNVGKVKTILLSTHILQEVSATCQRVLIINNGRLIAEGTPDSLTAESFAGSAYRASIRGPLAAILSEVKSMPDYLDGAVLDSIGDLHHLELRFATARDKSEDIFHAVAKNGWSLALLTREKRSLEDVFKNLTRIAS